jgi:DNA ligase-1
MQGDKGTAVNLKFAAFDLLYWNGRDWTGATLAERRNQLAALTATTSMMQVPVPISMSEGQLAQTKDDLNRLYAHFRAQGYEGIIAKDLEGTYKLSERDPTWLKRKPELTIDLVLLGAVLAVTEKTNAGTFGSYVIAARAPDGSFQDVGDVAGLDRERDMQIQQEIAREGLLTGKRIERKSASGVRPGFELRPSIVVTVKFEGIAREMQTGKLALRDPKVAMIRADKSAEEADTVQFIEEIYLRQRVG